MGSFVSNDKVVSEKANNHPFPEADWGAGVAKGPWTNLDNYGWDSKDVSNGVALCISHGPQTISDLVIRINCIDSNRIVDDKPKTDDFLHIYKIGNIKDGDKIAKREAKSYLLSLLQAHAFDAFDLNSNHPLQLEDVKIFYSGAAFWDAPQGGNIDHLIGRCVEDQTMFEALLQNFLNRYGCSKMMEFQVKMDVEEETLSLVGSQDAVHEAGLWLVDENDLATIQYPTTADRFGAHMAEQMAKFFEQYTNTFDPHAVQSTRVLQDRTEIQNQAQQDGENVKDDEVTIAFQQERLQSLLKESEVRQSEINLLVSQLDKTSVSTTNGTEPQPINPKNDHANGRRDGSGSSGASGIRGGASIYGTPSRTGDGIIISGTARKSSSKHQATNSAVLNNGLPAAHFDETGREKVKQKVAQVEDASYTAIP